jgi:hypothetical protein
VVHAQTSPDIFKAACRENVKTLDSMLKNVPISIKSENQSNLLHFATYCSNEAVFEYLMDKGIDVNALNVYGDSPLMYAVLRRNVTMTKALLDKGARVNTVNKDKLTPLYNAVQSDTEALIDLLLEANASVNLGTSLLHKAVLNNSLATVQKLVQKGAHIDPLNDYGNTPLAIAIREENIKIVEFLLANGADRKKVPTYNLQGAYLGQKKPDSIPVVFAKNIVSTENFVHSPTFSTDGNELYYTVESWRYHGGTIFETKQKNGVWTPPKPVKIDGDFREIDPILSADNSKLYYCTDRPIIAGDSVRNNCDLWMVKRQSDAWSQPIYLGENVNNAEHHDWFPSFSQDETLFFSTGPNNSSNIVYSKLKNNRYQKPIDLGTMINSTYRDYDPVIAPDESFIIFCFNRPNGQGSVDLYISFKDENNQWTKAKNMGTRINTKDIEFAPRLSPDGNYLFFNRGASIYWVSTKTIEALRT